MTTQEVKRKLAAILSADVKGYSRLMGKDEEWTLRTLNAYREIMRNLIQQHRGRIVDAPGDNALADFVSVVDAVQWAVEIQQVLRAKNAVLPETRRMDFRKRFEPSVYSSKLDRGKLWKHPKFINAL